jgi:hypothetical protein
MSGFSSPFPPAGIGAAASRDGVTVRPFGLGGEADVGFGGEYGLGRSSFFGSAAFASPAPPAPERDPTFSFGEYFFRTPSL